MKILYGFVILGIFGAMVSCESENEEELFATPIVSMNDTTMMATISFSMTIEPFFQNKCATSNCHEANAESPTLETYNQIKAQVNGGRIRARVIDKMPTRMPPSSRPELTDQEKRDLESWLDSGAPRN